MRKILYLSVFLGLSAIGWGQEQVQNKGYIPETFPVSPTTAELGKYGTYPVNKSTGVPNIEIPLYVIKSGGLELPIKLLYHASGIKVGQESSWVGLGWSLQAGGQINVQIRDTPDELENHFYTDGVFTIPEESILTDFLHQNRTNFHTINTSSYFLQSWVKDAYNIQLQNLVGTFFEGNLNNFEYTSKNPLNNYRIFKLHGQEHLKYGKFKVVDENGDIYYFNEEEKATKWNNPGQLTYTSSYLLNKAFTNNLKDSIVFSYHTIYDDIPYYDYKQSQTYNSRTSSFNSYVPFSVSISQIQIEPNTNLYQDAKKIKEIIFKGGRIRFILGNGMGRYSEKYLDKIIVEKKEGNNYYELKRYKFYYSFFPIQYNTINEHGRLRLDKVVEENYGDDKVLSEFIYDNNALPVMSNFSRDYFGYYNGYINESLIPQTTFLAPPAPGSSNHYYTIGNANRSVNVEKNQYGILKEIHYPTKGKTLFNYETNDYFGKEIFYHNNYTIGNLHLDNIGNGSTPPSFGEIDFNTSPPSTSECINSCNYNYCCPGIKSNTFNLQDYLSGTLIIDYNVLCSGICDNTNAKYAFAEVTVLNNGNEYTKNIKQGSGIDYMEVTQGPINMSLKIWGNTINANVSFRLLPREPIEKNNLAGGLRVSSIINYDNDGSFISKKVYDYKSSDNNSSGYLINSEYQMSSMWENDNLIHSVVYMPMPNSDPYVYTSNCISVIDFSKTFYSGTLQGMERNTVSYEYVNEKFVNENGNENIGNILYKFSVAPDIIIDNNIGNIRSSRDNIRGNLLTKKVFDNSGNLKSQTTNIYSENYNTYSHCNDFKMYRHKFSEYNYDLTDSLVSNSCPPDFDASTAFEAVFANTYIPFYKLDSTSETQYYDNGETTSTTFYNYSATNPLQLSSQTTTTSTGEVNKQQFYYPQDLLAQGVMTTEMQTLVNQNRIAEPIKTETLTTVNGTEVQTAETFTKYAQNANTGNLLLPIEIHSLKGTGEINPTNTTVRKITYDKYDAQGNILQYTLENGTPVSVIWGYSGQYPIAKIEGATYTTLGGYAEYLQIKSNEDIDSGISGNTESILRNALHSLRTGAINWGTDVVITTYTYDPLIGVTSITDPAGQTAYFLYDSFGRLQSVQDKDGKTLNNYEYHYKN